MVAVLTGPLPNTPTADQFRALWANHVIALFTYSRGLAGDDAAAREQARAELVRFENDIAAFFASPAQGLWGSRSRPGRVTSGDLQPGMIAEVSLRLRST